MTAGRDGAVKLWKFDGGNWVQVGCIEEHEGFVNSIAFIPSTSDYPNGKFYN